MKYLDLKKFENIYGEKLTLFPLVLTISKVSIGSDNGLLRVQCQATI